MILRLRDLLQRQTSHERTRHEVLNQRATLRGHLPGDGIHGDGGTQPDDEVDDAGLQAVGPIIAEDLVVCGVGEGDGVGEGEDGFAVCCFCTASCSVGRRREMPV